MRFIALFLTCVVTTGSASAQSPSDAAKAMTGAWEMSNSERDRLCNLNFKTDGAKGGFKVEFDAACGDAIPPMKEVEAWTISNDMLRLIDGRGRMVFEFSEVEVGMFEGERKGEGLFFLQNAASAAAMAPKRSPEQIVGEWTMMRAEVPVCALTLSNKPTKGFDEFVLSVKTPCDATLTRLNPNVWRLDRGELVLASPNGQSWRFEESEPSKCRRVPEGANPMMLVKK